jgi:hypothetical protein
MVQVLSASEDSCGEGALSYFITLSGVSAFPTPASIPFNPPFTSYRSIVKTRIEFFLLEKTINMISGWHKGSSTGQQPSYWRQVPNRRS